MDNNHARLFFVDNVRVLLIVLVISFHAAAPYAKVPWYSIQEETTETTEFVLAWFLTVCAAFFLSLFFMISGYFTPGSYKRKGVYTFLRDRLLRLGIPFAGFFFVVMPLFMYSLTWLDNSHVSYWEFLAEYHWDSHHLWFVETLLLFTVLYVFWQLLPIKVKRMNTLNNRHILFFTIIVAVTTFLVRIWSPIGVWDPFKLVQPAYLPQYLGLFIAGIAAYRNNWIITTPRSVGLTWLCTGGLAALLFLGIWEVAQGDYVTLTGGAHWRPFVFAVWETVVCVGLCVGLVILFRETLNIKPKLLRAVSASVYTMYLVHLPVVVYTQYCLVGVSLHPLMKFGVVVFTGALVSFAISLGVRRLPGARKIL
jgi:glucan biosynthesis protein C